MKIEIIVSEVDGDWSAMETFDEFPTAEDVKERLEDLLEVVHPTAYDDDWVQGDPYPRCVAEVFWGPEDNQKNVKVDIPVGRRGW